MVTLATTETGVAKGREQKGWHWPLGGGRGISLWQAGRGPNRTRPKVQLLPRKWPGSLACLIIPGLENVDRKTNDKLRRSGIRN